MQKRRFPFSIFFFAALFLMGGYVSAHAETLDDSTIRQIYGDIKGAIRDPDRLSQLMNERLDDNYILKSNVTRVVGTAAPQQLSENMTKRQFIEATLRNMSVVKMQDYQSTVTSITYSEDSKYATVYDTSTILGTLDIQTQQGSAVNVKYEGKENCSHILTLIDGAVKIMQSQCDDQITLSK